MGRYKQYTSTSKPLHNVPKRTRQRLFKKTLDLATGKPFSNRKLAASIASSSLNSENEGNPEVLEFTNQVGGSDDYESNQSDSDESENSDEVSFTNKSECEDKLFPGSRISCQESKMILLAYVHRYNLTRQATEDLLELVSFHLPADVTIQKSQYVLKKSLNNSRLHWDKHLYCKICLAYIGLNQQNCQNCQSHLTDGSLSTNNSSYFLLADCKQLIVSALEQSRDHIKCPRNNGQNNQHVSDITDGNLYKLINISDRNFSCSINTDGISMFKSSNFQLWPLYISINELPYNVRRKNCMLLALWFGVEKPNFSTFLKPLVSIFNDLSTNGIYWKTQNETTVKSKIYFPLLVCDSPARSCIQGMVHHNGRYSCPFCLNPGETFWISETTHKTIMPVIHPPSDLRTKVHFINSLKALREELLTCKHIKSKFGIQEASELLLLKTFDIVNGVAYDYMHSALLGVIRYFTLAMLDSKNSTEPYYIGTKTKILDSMCQNIMVPCIVPRGFRKLSLVNYWKANEWRTWVFVAPLLLKNILAEQYRLHFQKFCYACYLLLQDSIPVHSLDEAEKLLNEFSGAVAGLYGKKFLTFNLHITLHAPLIVRRWGPLWCYSAFPFEHQNGQLTRKINGTKFVAAELVEKMSQEFALKNMAMSAFKSSSKSHDFFASMIFHLKYFSFARKVQEFTIIGSSKPYYLSNNEIHVLEQQMSLEGLKEAKIFKKIIFKSLVFEAQKLRPTRFSDCIIAINNKFYVSKGFLVINTIVSEEVVFMLKKMSITKMNPGNHILKVTNIADTITFIKSPCTSIQLSKFIIIADNNDNIKYICKLPNVREVD